MTSSNNSPIKHFPQIFECNNQTFDHPFIIASDEELDEDTTREICLRGCTFYETVNISSVFMGKLIIENCTFCEGITLRDLAIVDWFFFKGNKIRGETRLHQITCLNKGPVICESSFDEGKIQFSSCRFKGSVQNPLDLRKLDISSDTLFFFSECTFEGQIIVDTVAQQIWLMAALQGITAPFPS